MIASRLAAFLLLSLVHTGLLGTPGQRGGQLPERYGRTDPGDPISPPPGKSSPDARAAWQAAMAVIGQIDGSDLRECSEGELWRRRGTYERETAWAPPHVAEELRVMRTTAVTPT